MIVLVPLIRVSKWFMTGRLINWLTFSTQHIQWKMVGILRWRSTWTTRRTRCLWSWIDKIRKYRSDYNNIPPNTTSFMSAFASTSGRLHSEFVRLLFWQDHRETDPSFPRKVRMWYGVVCKTVMSSWMSSGFCLGGGRDTVSCLAIKSIFRNSTFCGDDFILYYESIKWELQSRPINECRCDERLKTKAEESTHLTYTGLIGELEHLMNVFYYESRKWELKIRLMNEGRCNERLNTRDEESTCLTYTGLHDKTNWKYLEIKMRSTSEKSTNVMVEHTIQTRW